MARKEPTSPTRGPISFGKYVLLERLGVGGMAEVWVAKRAARADEPTELVALKRIRQELTDDPDFVRMFIDEAKIAGRLVHPGIVRMLELGRVKDAYYIAMELVLGRDLLQVLRAMKAKRMKLAAAGVAFIGARLAEALGYAHLRLDDTGRSLGLVHRDVSPQNVLIGFDGRLRLIDFGIAKAASRSTTTQVGTFKGKVGYMSPEQVRGDELDGRSDLFAVGTLLYELLTVSPLFARGNDLEAMNRVRDADVPPIEERAPGVPRALAAIVMKMLAKSPDDRFETAGQAARALDGFVEASEPGFDRDALVRWLDALFPEARAREASRFEALALGEGSSASLEARPFFDPDPEPEGATLVAGRESPRADASADEAMEVFFHRDEVLRLGEANPEGPTARPLTALFRPGRAKAVETFRAPLVERVDEESLRASPVPSVEPAAAGFSASPTPKTLVASAAEAKLGSTLPPPGRAAATPSSRPSHPPRPSTPPAPGGFRGPRLRARSSVAPGPPSTPTLEAPALEAPALEAPALEAPALDVSMSEAPMVAAPVLEAPTLEAPTLEVLRAPLQAHAPSRRGRGARGSRPDRLFFALAGLLALLILALAAALASITLRP